MCTRGGGGAVEVAADDGVRLDDGFSAEDDTLCSVDLGAAGDFVSRVLVILISLSILERNGTVGRHTVSMYSPLNALGGILCIQGD